MVRQTRSNQQGPRTLIVSWHWPPTNRASAGGLGHLFGAAPPGVFRVLTRSFREECITDHRPPSADLHQRVRPTYVPWPGDDQGQPTWRTWPAVIRTLRRFVAQAQRIHQAWAIERVLAVYPHRWSMLAGWRIAGRLGVPLVVYMRDLCAEGITFRNPLRRRFWRAVDRRCLKDAGLVLVPTQEFADHYERRGIPNCWVLPHCVPSGFHCEPGPATQVNPRGLKSAGHIPADSGSRLAPAGALHLIYSGAVYEPHADAARAFIEVTQTMKNVLVTYLTDPRACDGLLGRAGARWLPHGRAMDTLPQADAFVVLLGSRTPCPQEVQGCFPSKLIDYLMVGRPILAIVPAGCFVDRLITDNRCGLVVRDQHPTSIRGAIDHLRDLTERARMAEAGQRLVEELRSERWMGRLLERLQSGCRATDPGCGARRADRVSRSAEHVGPTVRTGPRWSAESHDLVCTADPVLAGWSKEDG